MFRHICSTPLCEGCNIKTKVQIRVLHLSKPSEKVHVIYKEHSISSPAKNNDTIISVHAPKDCAAINGINGGWMDLSCRLRLPCLCESPGKDCRSKCSPYKMVKQSTPMGGPLQGVPGWVAQGGAADAAWGLPSGLSWSGSEGWLRELSLSPPLCI